MNCFVITVTYRQCVSHALVKVVFVTSSFWRLEKGLPRVAAGMTAVYSFSRF